MTNVRSNLSFSAICLSVICLSAFFLFVCMFFDHISIRPNVFRRNVLLVICLSAICSTPAPSLWSRYVTGFSPGTAVTYCVFTNEYSRRGMLFLPGTLPFTMLFRMTKRQCRAFTHGYSGHLLCSALCRQETFLLNKRIKAMTNSL